MGKKMKPSRFCILLLSIVFFLFCEVPSSVFALSTRRDVEYFKGVDTIKVGWELPAGEALFPIAGRVWNEKNPFVAAVKDAFSNQKWITVIPQNSAEKTDNRNLVYLRFVVSGREEIVDAKRVKLGAISFHFWKMPGSSDDPITAAYIPPLSYPFIIPDTREQLEQEVNKGVHFLMDQFTESFECSREPSACDIHK